MLRARTPPRPRRGRDRRPCADAPAGTTKHETTRCPGRRSRDRACRRRRCCCARSRTRFGARLDGAPAHRGVAVVCEQARAVDAGGHLRLEAIVQPLVADRPPVAARDLVPLAPAVRRVALRAEHRLDIAERRVAGGDDAQRACAGESSVAGSSYRHASEGGRHPLASMEDARRHDNREA